MSTTKQRVFVTGGTGFLGRFLVERLLLQGREVVLLVRPGSQGKVDVLRHKLGVGQHQLHCVAGDIVQPGLGLSGADREQLKGTVSDFFHVAALYDLKAPAEQQQRVNVEGTRHALACARDVNARCFHYVSSTAVSGMYRGVFTETMYHEAENLDNAYFRTKHDAEGVVREAQDIAWRIYRPSGIVGHSQTGEIDKVDGPYYSFSLIRQFARLPAGLVFPGVKGRGALNLVPVDFVANAIAHISAKPGLEGGCFHLTNPTVYSPLELTNLFAAVAGAPRLSSRFAVRTDPGSVVSRLLSSRPGSYVGRQLLQKLGMPEAAVHTMRWETTYDTRGTQAALQDSQIMVPALHDYADVLWRYWEALDSRNRHAAALSGGEIHTS